MKEMKKISIFSLYYLLTYFIYAFSISQYIPYLTSIGYEAMEKSLLLSVIAIAGMGFQWIFGYLSDKWKTVKKILLVAFILYAIASYFLYNNETKIFIYHALAMSLSGGLYHLAFDLTDSWVMESGESVNRYYSFIRAFGSVGWAIGCLVVSQLIISSGYISIGISILLLSVLATAILLLLPDTNKTTQEGQSSLQIKEIKSLLTDRTYLLAICTLFMLFAINVLNIYSVVEKIIALGGGSLEVSYKNSIQATIEIPMFFLGAALAKKFTSYTFIGISAVAFGIQFMLIAWTDQVSVIILLCFFQCLTYPFMLMAAKQLMYDLSPTHLKSSGQLFAFSILNCFSAFLIPLLSGIITQQFGINACIYFGVLLAVAALCLRSILIRVAKEREILS